MKTVLYIDDDRDLSEIFCELLHSEGFNVWRASDGPEALMVLGEKGMPDLILLDFRMPQMNGEEFLAQARAKFAGLKNVYVLGLTGFRLNNPLIEGFRGAVNQLIEKPDDMDTFVGKVKEIKLTLKSPFAT